MVKFRKQLMVADEELDYQSRFNKSLIEKVKEFELWKSKPKNMYSASEVVGLWEVVRSRLQDEFGNQFSLQAIRNQWKCLRNRYMRYRRNTQGKAGTKVLEKYAELQFLNEEYMKNENIIPEQVETGQSEESILKLNSNESDLIEDSSQQHQYTLQCADSNGSGQSQNDVKIQLDFSNYQNTSDATNVCQYNNQNESLIIPIIQSDQLHQFQRDQQNRHLQTQQSIQSNSYQNVQPNDENDHFAKYVSMSLKKINPKQASKAKLAIQQIIFKFEQESFNEIPPEASYQPHLSNYNQRNVSRNELTENYVIRPTTNNGHYSRILCENDKDSTNQIEVIAIDDDIKMEAV